MVEGNQSSQWDHTVSVIATIVNVNRSKNSRTVRPEDLHPMKRSKSGTPLNRDNIHLLKRLAKK